MFMTIFSAWEETVSTDTIIWTTQCLQAINTAKAIKDNVTDKTNIWNVNMEKEYYESK